MSTRTPSGYLQGGRSSRNKSIGIGAVVAFHLLLLWALQNGLAHSVMNLVKKPIDATLIEEMKPKLPDLPPPPPPPPPKNVPPPEYVPPPEISSPAPAVAAPAITAVTREAPKPEAPPPPPRPANVRVAPVLQASNCSYSDADYPAAARRLEEEGTVVLRLQVGEDGRVTQSTVERSSGSARLDEAARQLALTRCRAAKVGTLDGTPAKDFVSIRWTWRIE